MVFGHLIVYLHIQHTVSIYAPRKLRGTFKAEAIHPFIIQPKAEFVLAAFRPNVIPAGKTEIVLMGRCVEGRNDGVYTLGLVQLVKTVIAIGHQVVVQIIVKAQIKALSGDLFLCIGGYPVGLEAGNAVGKLIGKGGVQAKLKANKIAVPTVKIGYVQVEPG